MPMHGKKKKSKMMSKGKKFVKLYLKNYKSKIILLKKQQFYLGYIFNLVSL